MVSQPWRMSCLPWQAGRSSTCAPLGKRSGVLSIAQEKGRMKPNISFILGVINFVVHFVVPLYELILILSKIKK